MPNEYWHAPETIENLNRLERPGFAVEFLRRNATYRHDYADALRRTVRNRLDIEAALIRFGRRWGLRFRP